LANKNLGPKIVALLTEGKKYDDIRNELSCSNSTITHHAKRNGLLRGRRGWNRNKHDWAAVQVDISAGMTVREAKQKWGFAVRSYEKAIKRGDLTPRTRDFLKDKSLSDLCLAFYGRRTMNYHRRLIRKKMVSEGRCDDACSECGLREWRGKRLTLEVDHKDGNPRNNVPENLRLLCPNCHSITETWRGRNRDGRKKELERRQVVRQEPLKLPHEGSNPSAPASANGESL
jgi:hypothetical protein